MCDTVDVRDGRRELQGVRVLLALGVAAVFAAQEVTGVVSTTGNHGASTPHSAGRQVEEWVCSGAAVGAGQVADGRGA